MKIAEGMVTREIMGQTVIVPTGAASEKFTGMIKLNETGAYIWKGIADNKDKNEIIKDMLDKYETSYENISNSFDEFVDGMIEKGFIIK